MDLFNKIQLRKATLADQEEACKDSRIAYYFARYIKGANIEKCQGAACKNYIWAFYFAHYVPGANIKKCQEAACKKPEYAYMFALLVKGANLEKCRKVCVGTMYYDMINKIIMQRALE